MVELCGAFGPAELPELLAGVDVAVMPSLWWDCAPLMAAECLAGRVPLVAPRLGGLGEAVRHEVDGLLFDGARRRRPRAPARSPRRRAGPARAPAGRDRGAAPVRRVRRRARGLLRRASARRARRWTPPRPAITWQGDHGLHTSLSHINNEVTARLERVQRLDRAGAPLDTPLPHPADVEVRHQWPPDLRPPRSGRLAVIQPWEFGAIPTEWVGPLTEDVDEVWVPSGYVRDMYLRAGLEDDRVHVVPNGVDLERFAPEGPAYALDAPAALRFLFVGGAIGRKGVDVLLAAWQQAFAGRDDVQLVIKDFGSDGVYRGADRSAVRRAGAGRRARAPRRRPRRRGDGGALPRLRRARASLSRRGLRHAGARGDGQRPARHPHGRRPDRRVLPAAGRLAHPLAPPGAARRPRRPLRDRSASRGCSSPTPRTSPSSCARPPRPAPRSARAAAPWAARPPCTSAGTASPALYAERAAALAARAPRPLAAERELDGAPAVLATPAWRGEDDLPRCCGRGRRRRPARCLYLLADPATDGEPAELEAHVMAAAAGIDLDACADIAILREYAVPGRDAALHAAADLYVPLHAACAGHLRLAGAKAATPAELGIRLAARPATHAA